MPHEIATPSPECLLLAKMGFDTPTPIQREAIPLLAQGHSVAALAPTGSGKTLAFLLPLMERMERGLAQTQLLVLSPTRELGHQIARVAERVADACADSGELLVRTAFGGQKAHNQKIEMRKRPAVVIATPGRALELLEQEVLCLKNLRSLVLDEADLMVGMGFSGQVSRICDFLPSRVQVALFSATPTALGTALENRLAHRGFKLDVRPEKTSADEAAPQEGGVEPGEPAVRHEILMVPRPQAKLESLLGLLHGVASRVRTGLIFCQTRESVAMLARELKGRGFSVEALSGELGQVERSTILRRFKAGGVQYLVATNLASRGIDVEALSVVINFDLPSTAEEYVHRSGRSGRAGKSGWTISLCNEKSSEFLKSILVPLELAPELIEGSLLPVPQKDETACPQEAPSFRKIHLNRGKSSKIRPGDVLGALTHDMGLTRHDVGNIFVFDHFTHVEVARERAQDVVTQLSRKRIKNLTVRATWASELSH